MMMNELLDAVKKVKAYSQLFNTGDADLHAAVAKIEQHILATVREDDDDRDEITIEALHRCVDGLVTTHPESVYSRFPLHFCKVRRGWDVRAGTLVMNVLLCSIRTVGELKELLKATKQVP
jgi:hypothetical protein